jgi:hypothetical protein
MLDILFSDAKQSRMSTELNECPFALIVWHHRVFQAHEIVTRKLFQRIISIANFAFVEVLYGYGAYFVFFGKLLTFRVFNYEGTPYL